MPDDDEIRTPDYDPKNPRCDQEQLKFIKECIAEGVEGIKKWNKWRKENEYVEIWLQEADLTKAHLVEANLSFAHMEKAILLEANLVIANLAGAYLENADFEKAHLEGADLTKAHLVGAQLVFAHLEDADLREAHLENANLARAYLKNVNFGEAHLENALLLNAHLENANFEFAHLENVTPQGANMEGAHLEFAHLEGTKLNCTHIGGASFEEADLRKADFSGTFLQGAIFRKAIVDGETLIRGRKINKRGIREKNYTDFAGVGLDSARIQPQIKQLLEYNIRKSNWSLWYIRLWNRNLFTKIVSSPLVPIKWILVRPFWWISNYGLSTLRIIITFFGLALIFALGYRFWPNCVLVNGQVGDIRGFIHALYFSVVTMTTLGFGDIAANPDSWQGQVLLMVQVIFGYVLLGALVTRFAVLFTAGGPAGKFEK